MFRSQSRTSLLPSLLLLAGAAWLMGCGIGSPSPKQGVTIHSFEVAPAHLEAPGQVTIRWETDGATTLELTRGGSSLGLEGQDIREGSLIVEVAESTTFTLEARNPAGLIATASRSVTVDPMPSIGELRAPEIVEANADGEAVALIGWGGVKDAEELVLEADGREPIVLDHEVSEGWVEVPLLEESTFTLVARNGGNRASLSVTIQVAYLPTIARFEVARTLLGLNESSTVSWETSSAYVELWLNGTQLLEELGPADGSMEVDFAFTSTLELHAFNELGTQVTATLEVEVGAPEILVLELSADKLWLGQTTMLDWVTRGGSELNVFLDETGEMLCEATDYDMIAASSCAWAPAAEGLYAVTFSLSNPSGVTSRSFEIFASGGPLITHFDVEPKILTTDEEIEIRWVVLDDPDGGVPALRLTDDRGHLYDTSNEEGFLRTTLAAAGSYELQLEATTDHPDSTPHHATASLVVHPRPVVDFVATPQRFDDSVDDEVILSWTTQHAASVVLYQLVDGAPVEIFEAVGAEREAGSYRFVPLAAETFHLVATNTIGGATTREVEVALAPIEVLMAEATPSSFTQGQEIRLSWVSRMADEVTLDVIKDGYLLEETSAPYLDLVDRGGIHLPMSNACGSVDTLGCGQISFPAGFHFPFGDHAYTSVWVHTPGYLSFDALERPTPSVSLNAPSFPTTQNDASVSIAPFWDAVAWDPVRYATGNVYHALLEEDGERIFVIQWRDIGHSVTSWRTASFNFEVVLRENGSFDFRYGAQSANGTAITSESLGGASATIGFQLPDQSASGVVSANGAPSINGARDRRTFSFRRVNPLPLRGELVFSPFARQENMTVTLTASRGGDSHSRPVQLQVARRPLIELTPEELAPVAMGEEFLLGWKTSNAESLVVVDDAGVVRFTAPSRAQIEEGLVALTEEVPGRHEYTVRVEGANGSLTEARIAVHVFGSFGIVSFTSDADSVEKGGDVLLRWEVFAAASVKVFADGIELHSDPTGAPQGSFLVTGVQQATEFKLVVRNDVGAEEEATLGVGLWDVLIGLQASATRVRPGYPVTITVDAKTLEGGTPLKVAGRLPLAEVENPGPTDRYQDISGLPQADILSISGTSNTSATKLALPSGLSFPFMGQEHTELMASVAGYVSFNQSASTVSGNVEFPATVGHAASVHLAPFWDTFFPRNVGMMHVALLDPDTYVIQWSKMSITTGSNNANPQDLNFQVVLRRDGGFDFRYGTMAPHPTFTASNCYPSDCTNEVNGSAATIGYQYPSAGVAYNYHFGGVNSALGNPPVEGGLANRTLRYPVIHGAGTFTFRPQRSETYSFCVDTASGPRCKELRIEAEFGMGSVALSKERVAFNEPVTLSWTSVGGKVLNVLDGETVVHTISNLSEIAQGSVVLHPTGTTVYVVELLAGSRRDTMQRVVDVDRFVLTATIGTSNGPGTPVDLSWTLTRTDPNADIHLVRPMEEISNSDWYDYDLTNVSGVRELMGAQADNTNVTLEFDDFTFHYFGTDHSTIRVAMDGYLGWDTSSSSPGNVSIPTTQGTNHTRAIAPFWDDLHTWGSGKVLSKKIDADRYVVQWSNVSLKRGSSDANRGSLNFLVVLHRNGTFEFRYHDMFPQPLPAGGASDCFPATCEREVKGSAATIGYQIPGGLAGYQLHFGGTNPGANNPIVAGGLSDRAWRFTPQRSAGSGSMQLRPTDNTAFHLCAFEAAVGELYCAPNIGVDVPWGIDLFQVTPAAPSAGQPVSLNWSVRGLDTLRVLVDGVGVETHHAPNIPLLGSFSHTPTGTTTYALEATSLQRVNTEERVVSLRTFELSVTSPIGTFLPGEVVDVQWQLTPNATGDVAILTPLSEIPLSPGHASSFLDVSLLPGATKLTPSNTSSGSAAVALPFTFPYVGTSRTDLHVFVDGYISFSGTGGNGNTNKAPFPTSSGATNRIHLAPFWNDLHLRAGSLWTYAPDPTTMIVQWSQLSLARSSAASEGYDLNFQVVLRADGSFEYRYGKMEPPPPPYAHHSCRPASCVNEANGSGAIIGYQTVDARFGSTLHVGSNPPAIEPEDEEELPSDPGDGFLPFPGGLSHRSFRYEPTLSGSARMVVGRSGKQEVCGILGEFSACRSVQIEAAAASGDLMITEVMIDPSAGVLGQWIEVRNLTSRTIDLDGFVLQSNQGNHIIKGPLPVGSGGFLTLASSSLVPFTPSYTYDGEVPLDRVLDTLTLSAGGTSIGSVSWGIGWDIPRNQVLSLDPSLHRTGIHETLDATKWCRTGSAGSPGVLGGSCLDADYDLDPISGRPFIDISNTGDRLYAVEGNQKLARLPQMDFKMKLFGEEYSRVWIASNGWISLSDTLPATNPSYDAPIPPRSASNARALKPPLISAFWTSLNHCGPRCKVFYELREISGVEVLIVQWQDFHLNTAYTGQLTFQAQLWENGDIVIAFDQVDNPHPPGSNDWALFVGNTAWIGLESSDPGRFLTAHHRRSLPLEGRSIFFRAK